MCVCVCVCPSVHYFFSVTATGLRYACYSKILERWRLHRMEGRRHGRGCKECALIDDLSKSHTIFICHLYVRSRYFNWWCSDASSVHWPSPGRICVCVCVFVCLIAGCCEVKKFIMHFLYVWQILEIQHAWVYFWQNYISFPKQQHTESGRRVMASLVLTVVVAVFVHASQCKTIATNSSCPTWLYLSDEGQCTCGSSLLNVLICSNVSQTVSIQNSFCLTSFDTERDPKKPVVGRCLYVLNHGKYIDGGFGLYYEVDQNLTQQDHQLCDYLNREGRLCGACKENHFISPYSYDMKCYECHRGLPANIVMYITVAYIPLTAFLVIVVVFHISVTSPQMNAAIFLCQVYALPSSLRFLTQTMRKIPIFLNNYTRFLATVYGIWNLDFFRMLISPICLPLTTMQVIALPSTFHTYWPTNCYTSNAKE